MVLLLFLTWNTSSAQSNLKIVTANKDSLAFFVIKSNQEWIRELIAYSSDLKQEQIILFRDALGQGCIYDPRLEFYNILTIGQLLRIAYQHSQYVNTQIDSILISQSMNIINPVINSYAKQQHYSLVIDSSKYLIGGNIQDITKQLEEQLQIKPLLLNTTTFWEIISLIASIYETPKLNR